MSREIRQKDLELFYAPSKFLSAASQQVRIFCSPSFCDADRFEVLFPDKVSPLPFCIKSGDSVWLDPATSSSAGRISVSAWSESAL